MMALCGVSGIPLHAGANGSFEAIRPTLRQRDHDGRAAVDFIIARARAQPAGTPLVLLPIGKLTNIALALVKDPSIARKVRVVWLGSNYPAPGEYNQDNDPESLRYVLSTEVPFEMVLVRYGRPSGTDAIRVTPEEVKARFAGRGPRAASPVMGRHGVAFSTFGDYAVNLFAHIEFDRTPPSRALYDVGAVAILKNPVVGDPTTPGRAGPGRHDLAGPRPAPAHGRDLGELRPRRHRRRLRADPRTPGRGTAVTGRPTGVDRPARVVLFN